MNKEENRVISNQSYEFNYTLTINDNILVTRDFNVRNFNVKFRESLEANYLMTILMGDGSARCGGHMGIIPKVIKKNSMKHLWDCYDSNRLGEVNMTPNTKPTIFRLDITKKVTTMDKDVILSSVFIADQYQPAVLKKNESYKIDLKSVLPTIMSTIKDYMSFENEDYNDTYGGVRLRRLNKISKNLLKDMKGERR